MLLERWNIKSLCSKVISNFEASLRLENLSKLYLMKANWGVGRFEQLHKVKSKSSTTKKCNFLDLRN